MKGSGLVIAVVAARLLALARRYLRDEVASREVVRNVLVHALRDRSTGDAAARSDLRLRERTLERALCELERRPPHASLRIDDLLPHFRADDTHARTPRAWPATVRPPARARLLLRHADRLPEPHRTVWMLGDADGMDAGWIARRLAISERDVKQRLHEARLALRTLLDAELREEIEASRTCSPLQQPRP